MLAEASLFTCCRCALTMLLTATSCTLQSLSLPKQAGLPPRASSAGRGTLSAPPIPRAQLQDFAELQEQWEAASRTKFAVLLITNKYCIFSHLDDHYDP